MNTAAKSPQRLEKQLLLDTRHLRIFVQYCKDNKISVVFTEEQASPQVSQVLARDAKAKVETIYTIETSAGNLSLYERQKANLEKIYNSL